MGLAVATLVGSGAVYARFNAGNEFFPEDIPPEPGAGERRGAARNAGRADRPPGARRGGAARHRGRHRGRRVGGGDGRRQRRPPGVGHGELRALRGTQQRRVRHHRSGARHRRHRHRRRRGHGGATGHGSAHRAGSQHRDRRPRPPGSEALRGSGGAPVGGVGAVRQARRAEERHGGGPAGAGGGGGPRARRPARVEHLRRGQHDSQRHQRARGEPVPRRRGRVRHHGATGRRVPGGSGLARRLGGGGQGRRADTALVGGELAHQPRPRRRDAQGPQPRGHRFLRRPLRVQRQRRGGRGGGRTGAVRGCPSARSTRCASPASSRNSRSRRRFCWPPFCWPLF